MLPRGLNLYYNVKLLAHLTTAHKTEQIYFSNDVLE